MPAIPQLSPAETQALLQRLGAAGRLLDVREGWEFDMVHVAGSQHIPMDQVPQRLKELNPEHTYAVLCHHGRRSQQVANFLDSQGFSHLVNVAGGIDAWAESLNPEMARY